MHLPNTPSFPLSTGRNGGTAWRLSIPNEYDMQAGFLVNVGRSTMSISHLLINAVLYVSNEASSRSREVLDNHSQHGSAVAQSPCRPLNVTRTRLRPSSMAFIEFRSGKEICCPAAIAEAPMST